MFHRIMITKKTTIQELIDTDKIAVKLTNRKDIDTFINMCMRKGRIKTFKERTLFWIDSSLSKGKDIYINIIRGDRGEGTMSWDDGDFYMKDGFKIVNFDNIKE